MNAAILIALESCSDPSLAETKYAAADVRALAAVLEQHGFAPSAREILINEQATKTAIESVVRTTLKKLTQRDTLYVYFAGPVNHTRDGDFLACFDTRAADAEHTSIRWDDLARTLRDSRCGRIVLFLDAGADVIISPPDRIVCLAACATGQHSHRSTALQHGIWSHHLIQAFDGRAKTALEERGRLSAASLQRYLASAVPMALRESDPSAVQSPQCFGNDAIILANVSDLIATRDVEKLPTAEQVKDAILVKETVQSAKKLAGFNKALGHAVPDRRGRGAEAFIASIAAEDMSTDVERVRTALKEAFGFTRRQLTTATHDGAATITTPHFNYNISVAQAEDDPANVVWRRTVEAITQPESVFSDAFEQVFAKTFDTIELSLRSAADIEGFIDFIEDLRSSDVQVDYSDDEHVAACTVRLRGHNATIEITRHTFSVRLPRAASPKLLVRSFFEIQRVLTQVHEVSMIPFGKLANNE